MRYPVGVTGLQEEFDTKWYSARKFGYRVDDWYHEGEDWNLLTGGNTDDREPLYAIADGKIAYYHYHSHIGSGYGRHLILRIEGPWGVRWAHYAHCHQDDFLNRAVEVREGQMIARISNSGTQLAHLHFAIYKKDPVGNIDRWARTRAELNEWWEDPAAFIKQWMQPASQPIITDETYIPQMSMKVREIRAFLASQQATIDSLNSKISQIKAIVQVG